MYQGNLFFKPFDVTADGTRILSRQPTDRDVEDTTYESLVVNWFDELRRRAPAVR